MEVKDKGGVGQGCREVFNMEVAALVSGMFTHGEKTLVKGRDIVCVLLDVVAPETELNCAISFNESFAAIAHDSVRRVTRRVYNWNKRREVNAIVKHVVGCS